MKYIEWSNVWLNNYIKTGTKSRTYERYSQTVKVNILPKLGEYELSDLTPIVLQTFITDMLNHGNRRTGKGLSPIP